jgi:hypothetical protein
MSSTIAVGQDELTIAAGRTFYRRTRDLGLTGDGSYLGRLHGLSGSQAAQRIAGVSGALSAQNLGHWLAHGDDDPHVVLIQQTLFRVLSMCVRNPRCKVRVF